LAALAGYGFAKIGLAGVATDPNWASRWGEFSRRLPADVRLVAVAYADWASCGAPSPSSVLAHAASAGCTALLVDTFLKDGRSSLQSMPAAELRNLIAHARRLELITVLAGSLRLSDLTEIAALRPDYLGVRGAVCQSGREGKLQTHRVYQWARALRSPVVGDEQMA
jgi:uncharacterized protein (UPF0264 family)